VDAYDGPFQAVGAADVAWRSDGHIKHSVRPETGVAPSVPTVIGKIVEQDFRARPDEGLQIGRGIAHHPVLFGDVEPSVPPIDAVGDLEAVQHFSHFFRMAVCVFVYDGVNRIAARADKDDAKGRHHRHGPRAGHPGVGFYYVSGRKSYQVEGLFRSRRGSGQNQYGEKDN